MSQVVVTLDRTANTSAATVPTALDEAVRDGRIQRGQLLLLEAFGGGWTWGSAFGAILIILLESRQNFKSAVKFDRTFFHLKITKRKGRFYSAFLSNNYHW